MMRHQLVGHCLPCNKLGRQTCERSSRKRVWIHLVTFVGALTMIIEIALKRPIGNPKMLGRVLLREGVLGANAQIVTSLTQVYVPVHGVIDRDI